jgi:hypothetical protein
MLSAARHGGKEAARWSGGTARGFEEDEFDRGMLAGGLD